MSFFVVWVTSSPGRGQGNLLQESELNFINILRTAFTLADPKSVKKTVKLSIFFTLLGSTSVKRKY